MNIRRMTLKKLKSELKFAEQFGKLNERNTYWDGRVDGLWLAVDTIKQYVDRFGEAEEDKNE